MGTVGGMSWRCKREMCGAGSGGDEVKFVNPFTSTLKTYNKVINMLKKPEECV